MCGDCISRDEFEALADRVEDLEDRVDELEAWKDRLELLESWVKSTYPNAEVGEDHV